MKQMYGNCLSSESQCGFVVLHTFYGKNYMLYNSVLLGDKKEQTTDTCNNMDESQMHQAKSKKPDRKRACFQKMHTMVENKSVVAQRGMIVKGHNKTFGGDRNVRYLDCDGHFVCVYLSKLIKLSTSCVRNLLYKITP